MHAPPRTVAGPTALTAIAAVTVALAGVRGPDYPAHYLRGELWRRAGAGVWNFTWYGGHATPTYSVIVPGVVAAIGPVVVCVVAAVVGTYAAARLVDSLAVDVGDVGRMLATSTFAAGAVVNVVVGRTSFAAGLALMLVALLVWRAGYAWWAAALALLVPLTSPVVAAFMAIVAAAVGLDAALARRRASAAQATAVLAAVAVPLGVMVLQFGSTGHFPYRSSHVVFSLILFAVMAAANRSRAVTIAAGVAAVAAIVLFAIPNPLGGNFSRFPQYLAVPVTVLGCVRSRGVLAWLAAAVALVGAAWTVEQAAVAGRQWSGDPSTDRAFHQPLIDELLRRNADGQPLGRVEIPFTDAHWEAYYVAPEVPYARGWERQVDLQRNDVLYDADLTADSYRAWLADNGVRWVAVAAVPVDEGGRAEVALIEARPAWLTQVWANSDWRLYEVAEYAPVVDPPAELVRQDADTLVLRTAAPADVTLRYHYGADLTIDGGACLAPEGEWMVARLPAAGEYTIAAPLAAWVPGTTGSACP